MAFADSELVEKNEQTAAPSFFHSEWLDVHSGGIALAGCVVFWAVFFTIVAMVWHYTF